MVVPTQNDRFWWLYHGLSHKLSSFKWKIHPDRRIHGSLGQSTSSSSHLHRDQPCGLKRLGGNGCSGPTVGETAPVQRQREPLISSWKKAASLVLKVEISSLFMESESFFFGGSRPNHQQNTAELNKPPVGLFPYLLILYDDYVIVVCNGATTWQCSGLMFWQHVPTIIYSYMLLYCIPNWSDFHKSIYSCCLRIVLQTPTLRSWHGFGDLMADASDGVGQRWVWGKPKEIGLVDEIWRWIRITWILFFLALVSKQMAVEPRILQWSSISTSVSTSISTSISIYLYLYIHTVWFSKG